MLLVSHLREVHWTTFVLRSIKSNRTYTIYFAVLERIAALNPLLW